MTVVLPTSFQKALGRVCVAGARAAYFGRSLDLDPHRNVTATVVLGLEAPFAWRTLDEDDAEAWRRERIALIPPGTLHHLRADGEVAFLYLDPLSDDHRRLAATALADALPRVLAQRAAHGEPSLQALCEALGLPQRAIGDLRISRAVRELERRPQDFATIDDAAACAGLSASRFRALFNREVGLPFRRYRLWRRMAQVMRGLSAARALTELAHEAGFSSSAHLSTAFREMFGLTPSDLRRAGVAIDLREDQPPS